MRKLREQHFNSAAVALTCSAVHAERAAPQDGAGDLAVWYYERASDGDYLPQVARTSNPRLCELEPRRSSYRRSARRNIADIAERTGPPPRQSRQQVWPSTQQVSCSDWHPAHELHGGPEQMPSTEQGRVYDCSRSLPPLQPCLTRRPRRRSPIYAGWAAPQLPPDSTDSYSAPRWPQRSSGRRPVPLEIRANMRGPISSESWKANT